MDIPIAFPAPLVSLEVADAIELPTPAKPRLPAEEEDDDDDDDDDDSRDALDSALVTDDADADDVNNNDDVPTGFDINILY